MNDRSTSALTPTGEAIAVFDLDGCLVDSSLAVPTAMNEALSLLSLPQVGVGFLVARVGPPLEVFTDELVRHLGADPALAPRLAALYLETYERRIALDTSAFDGIAETLDALADVRKVVVTMKRQHLAQALLTHLGLARHFVDVRGSEGGEPGKLPLLLTMVRSYKPDRGVMVGDTVDDVVAGRSSGLRTIAVTWGFGSEPALVASSPDSVVTDVTQLAAAVRCLLNHDPSDGDEVRAMV
jgi:phosphoglycolate phosphatase